MVVLSFFNSTCDCVSYGRPLLQRGFHTAGPILALPLFLISAVSSGRWMGWGDGVLELSLGWLLGLSLGATALMLAFWSGAIVGVILIVLSTLGSTSGRAKKRCYTLLCAARFRLRPFWYLGLSLFIFSCGFFQKHFVLLVVCSWTLGFTLIELSWLRASLLSSLSSFSSAMSASTAQPSCALLPTVSRSRCAKHSSTALRCERQVRAVFVPQATGPISNPAIPHIIFLPPTSTAMAL